MNEDDRLRRLEDVQDVRDTLSLYASTIDYGDDDAWLDCFTADASVDIRYRQPGARPRLAQGTQTESGVLHCGREQLIAFKAGHTRAPQHWHKHLIANVEVDVDGDQASASSYLLRSDETDGAIRIRTFGRYRDRLVRCPDQRWRFVERIIDIEAIEPTPASPADSAALAAIVGRLRLLEDEQAITRTLYRYAHAMYNGDRELFIDCFTDDAVIERTRHGRLVAGRPEIAAFFDAITHVPTACHKHVVIEPLIDVDGDVATVSSDFLYVQDRDGPMISHFGHYADELIRCPDGAWRFRRRALGTEATSPQEVSTIAGNPGTAFSESVLEPGREG
jgi:ketosteroid isomerase-like protein